MEDNITIKIKNWEIYNPRKDVKSNAWVRLNHDFFTHPSFYDFTFEERCFWLWILCERSKQKDDRDLQVKLNYCIRVHGFAENVIHRTLEKLKKEQIVEVRTLRGRYANVSNPGLTNERTGTIRDVTHVTNEREGTPVAASASVPGEPDPDIDLFGSGPPPKRVRSKKAKLVEESTLGSKIFTSYAAAYRKRWNKEPVRNARANSMAKKLGETLGEDAIDVANFYVGHNKAFYVSNCHSFKHLLADADALHTQWHNDMQITSGEARAVETNQNIANVWAPHLNRNGGQDGNEG